MSSTTVRPRFTFGIEIELLVKPKEGTRVYKDMLRFHFDKKVQPAKGVADDQKERNRTAIRRALAENLTGSADIPAKIEGSGYDTWYIKKEGSLDEVVDARGGGYWAIELVSHIFESDDPLWADEVHNIFEFVWDNFDVLLTKGCSMHVHVAPKEDWEVLPLRNIMKATGVFDDAIMKIMPAVRKENPWARSNFRDGPRNNPMGEDKATPDLKRKFDEVPSSAWRPLFGLFDQIKMVNMALLTWGQSRNVSWNLASLQKCGTVEFRRPPGVGTAADAQKWAAFTVAFACAATQTNWQTPWLSNNRHATVAELRSFVSRGLGLLGWERFLDPRVLVEITDPAMPFTAFDFEEVKRKLAKANRASGIEEKIVLSRQNSPASSQAHSPASSRAQSPTARKTDSQPNSPASGRPSSPAGGGRPSSPAGGGRPSSPAGGGRPSTPSGGGRPSTPSGGGRPTTPSGGGRPSSPMSARSNSPANRRPNSTSPPA